MTLGSHTHSMPSYVIASEDPAESVVRIRGDRGPETLGVVNGKIHRFWGLGWRRGWPGEHPESIGCHSINCTTHAHWEPL